MNYNIEATLHHAVIYRSCTCLLYQYAFFLGKIFVLVLQSDIRLLMKAFLHANDP